MLGRQYKAMAFNKNRMFSDLKIHSLVNKFLKPENIVTHFTGRNLEDLYYRARELFEERSGRSVNGTLHRWNLAASIFEKLGTYYDAVQCAEVVKKSIEHYTSQLNSLRAEEEAQIAREEKYIPSPKPIASTITNTPPSMTKTISLGG